MSNLVFRRLLSDSDQGKLTFGEYGLGTPGATVVSIRTETGFVTTVVSLFDGLSWVVASASIVQ